MSADAGPRPDAVKFPVTDRQYVVRMFQGSEYTVWADTFREGASSMDMTKFLVTESFEWVVSPVYGGGESSPCWVPSPKYWVALMVRASGVLSVEDRGSRTREVYCS